MKEEGRGTEEAETEREAEEKPRMCRQTFRRLRFYLASPGLDIDIHGNGNISFLHGRWQQQEEGTDKTNSARFSSGSTERVLYKPITIVSASSSSFHNLILQCTDRLHDAKIKASRKPKMPSLTSPRGIGIHPYVHTLTRIQNSLLLPKKNPRHSSCAGRI